MESLYILIPISIFFVFVIGVLFWWSTKSGQFDDLDGPGFRVVMDDDSTYDLVDADENAEAKSKDGSSQPEAAAKTQAGDENTSGENKA